MNNGDHRLLLERAATASMERIRRDGARAPEKIRRLFPYLKRNIFERYLDVNRMKRDCAIRDNSLSIYFADVTGQTPYAYIVERRLETVAAMLRDTDLRIWIASKLVGFSNQVILTRNFKACYGLTPRAFRAGTQKILARAGDQTVGTPSVDELRNALVHGPESMAAAELVMRITCHSSPSTALPSAPTPRRQEAADLITFAFAGEELERFKLEALWEEMQERSWPDQREMVRNGLAFSTPGFFHFLRKKSIPEGRDNRQYGVHLAELALDCLRVTERVIGEDLIDLRAQGWAWAGNARRLADDLTGAEAAFSTAEIYLENGKIEARIEAEYLGQKSILHLCQGRIDEAADLSDRALAIFRAIGTPREIARSLIERTCTLQRAGKDEESIAYSKEALQLLSRLSEPYLDFIAFLNLTTAYVNTGALDKAKEMLPRVQALRVAAHAGEASLHFIQWLEGRLAAAVGEFEEATDWFQAARAGFLELDQNIHAALVSLYFAISCWSQSRHDQVQEIILQIIPLLEAIQFRDEAAVGVKLLRSAVEKDGLTRKVLHEVRGCLDKLRSDPWS